MAGSRRAPHSLTAGTHHPDPQPGPPHHIAYPFSTMTIQRGLRELRSEGLIEARRTTRHPETGRRFMTGPRMIYTNRFNKLSIRSVPTPTP